MFASKSKVLSSCQEFASHMTVYPYAGHMPLSKAWLWSVGNKCQQVSKATCSGACGFIELVNTKGLGRQCSHLGGQGLVPLISSYDPCSQQSLFERQVTLSPELLFCQFTNMLRAQLHYANLLALRLWDLYNLFQEHLEDKVTGHWKGTLDCHLTQNVL